jgi:uncharacterized membrane protein YphA (DoxX/SURF4 family)
VQRRARLQRLFSAFPGGWPGVGLLLLRLAIGIVVLVQGESYIGGKIESVAQTWIATVGFAAGGVLLVGLLTPVAALVAGLGAITIGFSLLPAPPASNLLDSKLTVTLIAIVTAAILSLGPGAFSVDARLFGRREIIIPPRRGE